jgi:hypothetical protein
MEEEVLFKVELNQGMAFTNLERFKKGIVETKQEQNQLNKAFKDGNVTLDEYVAESVRLEQILKKETQAYNQLTKQVQGHESQTDKLIKSNKELAASNNKISSGFQSMAGNINIAGTNVGGLIGQFSAFLNPLTAVGAGVSALATAYFSTGRGAQDLEQIQFRLQATMEVLSNKVADFVDILKDSESPLGGFIDSLWESSTAAKALTLVWKATIGDQVDALAGIKDQLDDLNEARAVAQTKFNNLLDDNSTIQADILEAETKYIDKQDKLQLMRDNINNAFKETLSIKQKEVELLNQVLEVNKNDEATRRKINAINLEISQEERKREKLLAGVQKTTDNIEETERKRLAAVSAIEEKERLILEHKNAQIDTEEVSPIEFADLEIDAIARKTEAEIGYAMAVNQLSLNTDSLSSAIAKKNKVTEDGIKATTAAAKSDKDRTTGLMILSQALGGVATLFKENTIANKVFSAAQAGINSFLAGTQVLRDEKLPTFAKIPAMIAVIGAGLAQQVNILKTAFADGGLVGMLQGFAGGGALSGTRINSSHGRPIRRSNGDNILATVKSGEVILNERQQAMLGGSRTFKAIGVPGFADGGSTSLTASSIARSSESRSASREIFEAISRIKPVVTVEDINLGQQRVDVIDSMAQIIA